jgi:hypothetical protein
LLIVEESQILLVASKEFTPIFFQRKLVGGLGFEPRFAASKADVLPLDDPPIINNAVEAQELYHLNSQGKIVY